MRNFRNSRVLELIDLFRKRDDFLKIILIDIPFVLLGHYSPLQLIDFPLVEDVFRLERIANEIDFVFRVPIREENPQDFILLSDQGTNLFVAIVLGRSSLDQTPDFHLVEINQVL